MSESQLEHLLSLRQAEQGNIVDVDEETIKLVIFTLSGQYFAFHGEGIREILAEAEVYFLPGCPPSLEGVVNIRGDIESVIQLQQRLQLPARSKGVILLGQTSTLRSGIRADQVVDVIDLPSSQIAQAPATLPTHLQGVVIGLLSYRQHTVSLLDLERIFADYARGLG